MTEKYKSEGEMIIQDGTILSTQKVNKSTNITLSEAIDKIQNSNKFWGWVLGLLSGIIGGTLSGLIVFYITTK